MPFQVDHIDQLSSILVHWMVVIFYEKVFDDVRFRESAALVEMKYRGAIARSDIQLATGFLAVVDDVREQTSSISPTLILRNSDDIFDFIYTCFLARNDAKRPNIVIKQGEHIAAIQIFFYHAYLLIRDQKQVHVLTFIAIIDFRYFHPSSSSTCFYHRAMGKAIAVARDIAPEILGPGRVSLDLFVETGLSPKDSGKPIDGPER
jgi:hypothetical protein